MILISQILIIYLPGNISRPGALGYQFLTSHLQHYSGSPRITPARPELPWLTQGQQLIQDHLDPFRISPAYPARVSGLPFTPPMTVQPEHQPAPQALHSQSSLRSQSGLATTSGAARQTLRSTSDLARYLRHASNSSLPTTSDLAPHLKPCAARQSLRSPLMLCKTLQTAHTPSSLVRRNGKLQRQPLGLLAQTPHSVRVLLHKPRPGAPSGIGELFDAVDH